MLWLEGDQPRRAGPRSGSHTFFLPPNLLLPVLLGASHTHVAPDTASQTLPMSPENSLFVPRAGDSDTGRGRGLSRPGSGQGILRLSVVWDEYRLWVGRSLWALQTLPRRVGDSG